MGKSAVRWGILSTAQIGRNVFVPAVRQTKDAELVAIASRERNRAQAYARKLGIPTVYDSYDALLAADEIDAIYNPLPNAMHEEWTCKAADHGKHVLCEKPLSVDAAGARRMVEYCRSKGVHLFEAFVFLYHPQTRWLRTHGLSRIGTLIQLHAQLTFRMARPAQNIRLVSELGGGSLYDVGSYPITFARCMFGEEPTHVQCATHVDPEYRVDTRAGIQLLFSEGRIATLQCGFDAAGGPHAALLGAAGSIAIPQPYHPRKSSSVQVVTDVTTERITMEHRVPPFTPAIEHFQAVINGAAATYTAAFAAGTAAVIDAAFASAKSGHTVAL